MKKLCILIALTSVLCPLISESANRPITQTWDIQNSSRRPMELTVFQAEGIGLTLTTTDGTAAFALTTNDIPVWEISGWSDYTNIYAAVTGTVSSASGGITEFTLSPALANFPAGTYRGYVKAMTATGTNITTRAVLAYQRIRVEWSPESGSFALVTPSPYYYTKTEVDIMTAALASDLSDLSNRSDAIEAQTNLIQSAIQTETDPLWTAASGSVYSAIADAEPGNYAAVSNAALSAVQTEIDPLWAASTNATQTRFQTLETATNNLASDIGSLTSGVSALEGRSNVWNNAVQQNDPLSVTNDSTWTGWTTTGDLTASNTIYMTKGEYLLSPVQTNGIADYTVTDLSSWQIDVLAVVGTNEVALPYYGANAQLKIEVPSQIGIPGQVVHANLTNVVIVGYTDRALAADKPYVSGLCRIEIETEDCDVTRKIYVDDGDADSVATASAALAAYAADADKTVRGSQLRLGNMWVVSPADSSGTRFVVSGGEIGGAGELLGTTNEFVISKNDYPLMSFTSEAGGLYITNHSFEVSGENVTVSLYIATNGVASAPFAEYAETLSADEWSRVLSPTVDTYPTVSNGTYEITFTVPATDTMYVRAMQQIGDSIARVETDVLIIDGAISNTAFQAAQSAIGNLQNDIANLETEVDEIGNVVWFTSSDQAFISIGENDFYIFASPTPTDTVFSIGQWTVSPTNATLAIGTNTVEVRP